MSKRTRPTKGRAGGGGVEPDTDQILTVATVARLFFRGSEKGVYQRVARGTLPVIRDGRRILFSARDLHAYFEASKTVSVEQAIARQRALRDARI